MRRPALSSLALVLGAGGLLVACGGGSTAGAEVPDAEHRHAGGHGEPAHGEHDPGDGEHGHRHDGAGMRHSFEDAERFARVFDDPERDAWQRPREVVALLALAPGMTVADLGAGTGYFLPHLAAAVAPGGTVLGLDVEPNMVEWMNRRIARDGLEGAVAQVVAPDDPGLDPSSVDRILTVDTWHHVDDRPAYAARLRGALRPGGSLLVVDFDLDSPRGPPRAHKLDPAVVVDELRGGGFRDVVVLEESLPDQYVVRATRAAD